MYKRPQPTFDQALSALTAAGFEMGTITGVPGRVVRKYGCAAGIDRDTEADRVHVTLRPGYMVGGEVARLLDKGYQKFFKTSKLEIAATADALKAIHQFAEELKEAAGLTSLYNESLGTVSDAYVYDRVKGRDDENAPRRPWQK
jgi:hypothetical protein